MRYSIICLFLTFNVFAYSQGLSPERVKRIKDATVRITIEGVDKMGTGFFVNQDGTMLTCWHVIEPAFIRDTLGRINGMKKVWAQLNTGEKFEILLTTYFLNDGNQDAVAYDYCLIGIMNPPKQRVFPALKVGKFEDLNEGDEVYTCGYPIAIHQQFITKGIVSTKYTDSTNFVITNGVRVSKPRTQALIDITMNKGNSGGAIIKFGNTIDNDAVVGIADFIINPIGNIADQLTNAFKANRGIQIQNIDPAQVYALFTEVFTNTSIGVSGCVSINYVRDGFNKMMSNKK